ncbi:MAG TPA: DMT family transporter [Acidimicrobiia bacterium]|jgi:drug/metabolite transporter (DMT)-like permease
MSAWHYIVFVGVMFGTGALITEWILDRGGDPLALTAVAFISTAVVAVVIRKRFTDPGPGGWRTGILLGMLNASGPAILFNLGFDELPASVNTLLISLGPVFTAITAHFIAAGDRFNAKKAVGLLVSLIGVAVLASGPSADGPGSGSLRGFLFTFAGAALQGISLVWVKRMVERYRAQTSLAPMMVGAAVLALIVAILAGHPPAPSAFPLSHWVIIVTMGATGVVTFFALLKANELAPASQAALIGYIVPLVGVGGGVLLMGEPMTASLLIGGVMVVAGVVLVGRNSGSPVEVGGYPHPPP